jgi:hypothetical protein
MRLTKYASEAILSVMDRIGLDPAKCYFGVKQLDNGALGIGFTEESEGETTEHGKLRVTIANNVNTENVVVDFGEVDGKQGLVFISEEEYVNNQPE